MNIEIKYNNPVIIFHHNDMDGIMSAMTIKLKYDNNMIDTDYDHNVYCVPCDYGCTLEYIKDIIQGCYDQSKMRGVINNATVFVVDMCLKPAENMIKLNNWLTQSKVELIWIDHHISSIEELSHLNFPGVQRSGTAACKLTWDFLYNNVKAPKIIDMISDFDVQNPSSEFEKDTILLPLISYLDSFIYNLNENESDGVKLLKKCFYDETIIDQCIERGKFIMQYLVNINIKHVDKFYEFKIGQYNAVVFNTPIKGHEQFIGYNKPHDIKIVWYYDGTCYNYSFYSSDPNIDCSKIAATYGGGGHKGAAGCKRRSPIF